MKKEEYLDWLINERSYARKVASDMACRASRVCRILEITDIEDSTIQKLEASGEFQALSVGVKSQLRKTCREYNEFKKKNL